MCRADAILTSYVFYFRASCVRKFSTARPLEDSVCRPYRRVSKIPMGPMERRLPVHGKGQLCREQVMDGKVIGEFKRMPVLSQADVVPSDAYVEVIGDHVSHLQQ